MKSLSQRLSAVAERVPKGYVVVDVGSDHGRLPIHLVRSGTAPRCVAVELLAQPCAVARRAVQEAGLTDRIDVRFGDGLEPLNANEAEVICMAGMGGVNMVGILSRGRDRLGAVKRLVLQPIRGDERLRRYLMDEGWQLIDELALEERGWVYTILVAERGDPEAPYRGQTLDREALLRAGPLLLQSPNEAQRIRWREEKAHLLRVMNGVRRNPSPRNQAKLAQVNREMSTVEAILKALGETDPETL
ncbi:MAG: tRNA (adenine(22)-N(1))-methyltransferase TrmK [Myxococcota bacterium]